MSDSTCRPDAGKAKGPRGPFFAHRHTSRMGYPSAAVRLPTITSTWVIKLRTGAPFRHFRARLYKEFCPGRQARTALDRGAGRCGAALEKHQDV